MISISKEYFFELFGEHSDLYYLLTTKPESIQDLTDYYLPSKLWRLNNLYSVINKDGERCQFKLNAAQFKVYSKLLLHPRLIILKSRQQGISTFFLIDFFDDAIFRSYFNIGLMAQGREEASTLLERIKFAWDNLDEEVKSFVNRKKIRDNSNEFTFNNNSTIFIRTSFRSATLQRLHISEYGKIANASPKKAAETKTGTLQTIAAGNEVIVESTAEGVNDFKYMWDQAVAVKQRVDSGLTQFAAKDFYPVFLSWLDDPTCIEPVLQEDTNESKDYFSLLKKEGISFTQQQKNFWIVQYRELEDAIYQEYPATATEAFRAGKNGSYWAKLYIKWVVQHKRIRSNLWDRNLPVYVSVDLGRDDYFVFCFFQVWENTIRIIGEFFNNGEGLDYYASYLLNDIPKGWDIQEIYLPHDFGVADISIKDNKTRQDIWGEMGITNTVLLEKDDIDTGIELVRQYIPTIYIDVVCEYLESCFMGYTKTWDDKTQRWTDKPAKNNFCHGADTIRYMCQAVSYYHQFKMIVKKKIKSKIAL